MSPSDRRHDDGSEPTFNNRSSEFWSCHFPDLTEFDQPLFICKYNGSDASSAGCSKIDRIYTSLSCLQLSTLGYSCNLLNIRHNLSDHAPVSIRSFSIDKLAGVVPSHISSSSIFAMHLRKQFALYHLLPPHSHHDHDMSADVLLPKSANDLAPLFAADCMRYISVVQACIRAAASFTKHDMQCATPTCSQHKALLV